MRLIDGCSSGSVASKDVVVLSYPTPHLNSRAAGMHRVGTRNWSILLLVACLLSGCAAPPAVIALWAGVAASSAAVVGVSIEAEQACHMQGGCTHVPLPP